MSDHINIVRGVESLDVSPQFTNYSKVRILVGENNSGDNVTYEAGNNSGLTLEIANPFGTQAMANRILQKLRGYQYQPFRASGAPLDPAAEVGDGLSVRDVYGGIYSRKRSFTRLMKADVEAPHDEEIDHEYKYETSQERKYQRQLADVKATVLIQSGQIQLAVQKADQALSQITQTATDIDAKVTADMSGTRKTFGWNLKATSWELYANDKTVFKATKDGIEVTGSGTFSGTVNASGGKIGGFNIGKSAIYNNISKYGGSQKTGVYLGTDGIQLGQKFKVNSSGDMTVNNMTANNMTASNATLSGTLTIGGKQITASSLYTGASQSSKNYETWSEGASYGINFDSMKNGGNNAYPINASSLRYQGKQYTPQEMSFKDYYGNTRTIKYIGLVQEQGG